MSMNKKDSRLEIVDDQEEAAGNTRVTKENNIIDEVELIEENF